MATDLIRTASPLPNVFDEFFTPWDDGFRRDNFRGTVTTIPAVNISEEPDDFLVSLAAPGMEKKDFRIDVQGKILTISAEKQEKKEESDNLFYRREYNFSSFSRSFTLPEDVKTDSIAAKYENGILILTLPKKEKVKRAAAVKSIAVK